MIYNKYQQLLIKDSELYHTSHNLSKDWLNYSLLESTPMIVPYLGFLKFRSNEGNFFPLVVEHSIFAYEPYKKHSEISDFQLLRKSPRPAYNSKLSPDYYINLTFIDKKTHKIQDWQYRCLISQAKI